MGEPVNPAPAEVSSTTEKGEAAALRPPRPVNGAGPKLTPSRPSIRMTKPLANGEEPKPASQRDPSIVATAKVKAASTPRMAAVRPGSSPRIVKRASNPQIAEGAAVEAEPASSLAVVAGPPPLPEVLPEPALAAPMTFPATEKELVIDLTPASEDEITRVGRPPIAASLAMPTPADAIVPAAVAPPAAAPAMPAVPAVEESLETRVTESPAELSLTAPSLEPTGARSEMADLSVDSTSAVTAGIDGRRPFVSSLATVVVAQDETIVVRRKPPMKKARSRWPIAAALFVGAACAFVAANGRSVNWTARRPSKPTAVQANVAAPLVATAALPAAVAPSVAPVAPVEHVAASPVASAPPAASPVASAPPAAEAKPAGTGMGMGMIKTEGAIAGRRIFVDKRAVGQTPASVAVKCGKHEIKLGSSGKASEIDVPCDGEIAIGDH